MSKITVLASFYPKEDKYNQVKEILLCTKHRIIQPVPITPVPMTATFFILYITCV